MSNRQKEKTKSILVVPSKIVPNVDADHPEGLEETEITAALSVPTEGGWGWVVVFASFSIFFILDGVFFTFGSIYQDMTADLEIEGTLVALVNSIAVALYFICGPVISALINRFGFRACTMTGSIVLSISYLSSYFVNSYIALVIFYGVTAGVGACLVLVPSAIVVGFYFERLRAMALAIAGLGSSLGISIMFTVNSILVNFAGWRIVTLFHAGLFGMIYFLGMAYRPLLVVTLTQTQTDTHDPTRTVTYLPSVHRSSVSGTKPKMESTAAERLFSAVSSPKFPTTASILQEASKVPAGQAGPSTQPVSKLTISARNTTGSVSRRHLSQIQSMITNKDNIRVEVDVKEQEDAAKQGRKRKWWTRLCCIWESHVQESRPMYRDDAFYAGEIEKLPIYQKSVVEVDPDARTGLEYQMAVSRAVRTTDLEEHKGVCTTAVRRVLATMMDPQLLKSCSFLLLCLSAILTYIGLLTPYVFLPDRNRGEGIEEQHCNLFVSVIGFCNALGRILAGIMASKFNSLILYQISCILAGIGTLAYNFSFNIYYQYFVCVIFGCFIAAISGLRSLVLVHCYGLEKLTNATGMMLMSQGIGSLMSTPLSGVLKTHFGYAVSFYVAGAAIILSGVVLLPVNKMVVREKRCLENNNLQSKSKQAVNVQKK